jgi:hypothetical protein
MKEKKDCSPDLSPDPESNEVSCRTYKAINNRNKYSRKPKHCRSVEIDWEYFQGSRGKQDIGALLKTTVFDENLIRALCSANSSN